MIPPTAVDTTVLLILLRRITDLEDQLAGARAACEREQEEHLAYRRQHPERGAR
ncbi:hypothetical protein FHS39_002519 [Streptomyces olivoverticillatus]|uniref:Uncharacterized protein n=1 Tax=Streptomyces olivoverticillatus TaxID=66427 RepID=A0A7W7LPK2_9ACTN|nr:hypothetical protein [Streptomyces olivoverticillatus]MBB4893488.1 hypothetical protein [Streptomyces olivoverticillatus]